MKEVTFVIDFEGWVKIQRAWEWLSRPRECYGRQLGVEKTQNMSRPVSSLTKGSFVPEDERWSPGWEDVLGLEWVEP